MKNIILASIIVTILCSSSTLITKKLSLGINQTKQSPAKIFIKDPSKYSKTFLSALKASKERQQIKVIDNYIVVGKDTTKFPHDLNLNKDYTFMAIKGDQVYNLKVKRINETTLNYNFSLYKKKSLAYTDKGEATIGASFYLASEMDEDTPKGSGYESYDYFKSSKGCWFNIRIGVGKDTRNKQRAKVLFGCNDKSGMTLDLANCPTLRTN